jgi:hypothetical protein
MTLRTKFTSVVHVVKYETPLPPRLIIDQGFPDPAKLVELTPCGHSSEKNSISTAYK